MAIELRLLGPFEAFSDGAALPLGGPKQRAVLALLALHVNEVVSVDRLIDELWGAAAPPTVDSYIQNCISRLRRVLGKDAIETRHPGYALRLDSESIDAHRFEQGVRHAYALEPAARCEALGQALALWRGPALADFLYEAFAQGAQSRLEALRVDALEGRVAARLGIGEGAELVAEIDALVRANPDREQLRAHQMVALYRSGRQGDALRAYQDARVALLETNGLEPGDELRELHRRILAHDASLLPPGQAASRQESTSTRRQVTIVAARIELGDRADPEEEAQEIVEARDAFAAAAWRHGGSVEQQLGDEVVLAFGVPAVHEDDALRALRAATEAQAELMATGAVVRIGVEAGELLVGSDRGDLAGGAVTAARRLAVEAAPAEILLGRSVATLVRRAVIDEPARSRGARRLVRLQGELAAALEPPRTPMVGREQELALLHRAFENATRHVRCQRVVVIGEAGIGKSRLAAELATTVPGAAVAAGRCAPYGGTAMRPLVEIVSALLGSPGDLREALSGALGDSAEDVAAAGLLTVLLGLDAGPVTLVDTFWAVRRLFERLAGERPLLLVLEDVHWAAEPLLDLVDYLVASGAPGRLLLAAFGRLELAEVRSAWAEAAVRLEPLDPESSRRLVETTPGRSELSDADVEPLVEAAEGNPLFLEQLVTHTVEAGGDGLPLTLATLLAARLDRINPLERAVLERAAVVGRSFGVGEVRALTPFAERGALALRLSGLAGRRLLRPDGQGGFLFEHALVRDAAYSAIPKAVRVDLHERLARWLGDTGGPDETVGFHLEQAYRYGAELGHGDAELAAQAGHRLGDAGIRALQRYDNSSAVDLLGRAIVLLPDDEPSRLELACEHGLALKNAGDVVSALAALDEVAVAARAAGDERMELRAGVEQIWPHLLRSETTPDAALELLDAAVKACEAAQDERGLSRAFQLVAAVTGAILGRRAESERAAERSLEYYRATGYAPRGCVSLLAWAAVCGPRPAAEARAIIERLHEERYIDRGSYADLRTMEAYLDAREGRFDEARVRLREARSTYIELGAETQLLADPTSVAVFVEFVDDNHQSADELLRRACEALEATGDVARLGGHLAWRAELACLRGDVSSALVLSKQAASLSPDYDVVPQALWRRARAKALAVTRVDEGERLARDAVELLSATDELDALAEAWLALGEVLELGGDRAQADEAFERAHDLFQRKGNLVRAQVARRLRDESRTFAEGGRASPPSGRTSLSSRSCSRSKRARGPRS